MEFEEVGKVARAQVAELFKAAPDVMRSFQGVMRAAGKEGALTMKAKELMALAIATNAKCEGCIVFTIQNLREHGATRAEVVEAVCVAIEMGGGPATVFGGKALNAFDQLSSPAT